MLDARGGTPYEALDTSAMPVGDAKRRGEGWLAGYADIGWSNSLGWYEGFRLLVAVNPAGAITSVLLDESANNASPAAKMAAEGKKKGERLPSSPASWPAALRRRVRAWLEPYLMLWRYWRAFTDLPPPKEVRALLERVSTGRGLYLYVR